MTFQRLFFIDFPKIRSLVENSRHMLFVVNSIIAGNTPVEIWVDNLDKPNALYIWDGSNCHYIAGRANNSEFNSKMEEYIDNTVFPRSLKNGYPYFKIEHSDKSWEVIIENILLKHKYIKKEYRFFELNKFMLMDWEKIVPGGFSIHKIDKSLLESEIKNIEEVKFEINKMWGMQENYLEKGFGYCAILESEDGSKSLEGWCTAEYLSKGKCGIGIETFKKYQRLGLATIMTANFVEHSVKSKIRPYWDTSAENLISIKVAEKSGFAKIQDYFAYNGKITL